MNAVKVRLIGDYKLIVGVSVSPVVPGFSRDIILPSKIFQSKNKLNQELCLMCVCVSVPNELRLIQMLSWTACAKCPV